MKKNIAFLLLIAALTNLLAILIIVPLNHAFSADAKTQSASLTVKVLDALTHKPIEGATVCVIETKSYYQTDKDGQTQKFEVPVLKNQSFDQSEPREFGEISLYIYKDGYIDFMLFFVTVRENQHRQGPEITLYPYDGSTDLHTIIEAPDSEWVRKLVKRYKK